MYNKLQQLQNQLITAEEPVFIRYFVRICFVSLILDSSNYKSVCVCVCVSIWFFFYQIQTATTISNCYLHCCMHVFVFVASSRFLLHYHHHNHHLLVSFFCFSGWFGVCILFLYFLLLLLLLFVYIGSKWIFLVGFYVHI